MCHGRFRWAVPAHVQDLYRTILINEVNKFNRYLCFAGEKGGDDLSGGKPLASGVFVVSYVFVMF